MFRRSLNQEEPYNLSGLDILNILKCDKNPVLPMDLDYYLPSDRYLKAFYKFHAKDLRKNKIIKYRGKNGGGTRDCDDFALRLLSNARVFYARHPQDGADALSIGVMTYTKYNGYRHMCCSTVSAPWAIQ